MRDGPEGYGIYISVIVRIDIGWEPEPRPEQDNDCFHFGVESPKEDSPKPTSIHLSRRLYVAVPDERTSEAI
jgi:hypothetical protein